MKYLILVLIKLVNLNIFDTLRQFILKSQLNSYGHGVEIHSHVIIKNPQYVKIGHHVSIASFVHIWGKGSVTIGNHVLIGSHTSIVSETHDYHQPLMYNSHVNKPIIIEDNVWIGSHCVIMPGVTIRSGSVIGAGSIVTKNTQENSIYVGLPAKKIKNRIINEEVPPFDLNIDEIVKDV